MARSFSIRDWCGIAVGVICALIPQLIFKSRDITPFWTTILLAPPLVFLVSPKRPILSWQVPIITVAIFAALTSREPWEPRYSKGQLGVVLLTVGLIVPLRTYDSTDPRDSAVPFEGFLMVTLGVGIAVAACRIAARLGASKGVEDVLGLAFSFFGIPGFIGLIATLWEEPKSATGLPSTGVFWFAITVLEIVAVLVWLLAKGRRARKAVVTARNQD